MYKFTMRYSKEQAKNVIIKIWCNGLVEGYVGFDTIPQAFSWLNTATKQYAKT